MKQMLKLNPLRRRWNAALHGACMAGCVGLLNAYALQAQAASVPCASLSGKTIAAADIGLPTTGATVTAATLVAANAPGNTNGEYCKVTGSIHPVDPTAPNILIQVNLPTNWNKRALQLGGGGYDGSVVTGLGTVMEGTSTTPLSQGYVTFGGDSGHQGGGASFARNQEAMVNYGYASLKKTHDVAAYLVNAYYGEKQKYMYFAGGSTGGAEALMVAQRFGEDYDGILAASARANFTGIRLMGQIIGRPEYGVPGGFPNRTKQLLIPNAALANCDHLDGVVDGMISNVAACRAISEQTIASLRCPGGADTGNTCLSDLQLNVVRAQHAGFTLPYILADGVNSYRGNNVLEGTGLRDSFNYGTSATVTNPPTNNTNGFLFASGDDWLKNFITGDPNFNSLNFDPLNPGPYKQTLIDQSFILSATNPDLSKFANHGGKLLLTHGTEDMAIATDNSVDYYNRVVAFSGQAAVDSFLRFYLIAGFGHFQGAFNLAFDGIGALDAWVSQGVAPGTLVGADSNAATLGRTRPLCIFPGWPKYVAGDPNLASSFTCVESRVPFTPSTLTSGNACNGVYNGNFKGNVTVSAGQNCTFINGSITGNVQAHGGNLVLSGVSIGGNVQVNGGGTFSIGPSTAIDGNLQIQNIPAGTAQNRVCGAAVSGNLQVQNNGTPVQIGSTSPWLCVGNEIGGNLQVQNNTASTAIASNTVNGNLQDQNNSAPTQIFGNTVSKNLQCDNNSSVTGGGNTAGKKQGQCLGL